MYSLINDLSTLTTIPIVSLNDLVKNSIYCICDSLEDAKLGNEEVTEIDIGIGTLTIKLKDNRVQYRFIPSKQLESNITSTIIEGKNVLVATAEENLVDRITNAYKNYFR